MPSDAELLEQWNAGDASAGEALFERHFDGLFRFFRNKAPDESDELVQRTFAACLEKRLKLRDAASFRAFLFGVARIEFLQLMRRKAKAERNVDLSKASVFDFDPSPSRIVAHKQEQRLLLEALRRIPVDLQIVIELHYWEELSTTEIAHVIEVPQGTVKSRLRRAREAIEEVLQSLATEPALLSSTTADIDGWVVDVKGLLQASE